MSAAPSARLPSLFWSLVPVAILIALLTSSVMLFGDSSSFGPNQIALLLASAIGIAIALAHGHRWAVLEQGIMRGISVALGAVLILLMIGALIGTWLLAGTVPTLIYYGLQLIDPNWFYFTCCVVCAIVSLSIGSSWTTAATVGVAFIGVAQGLELSLAITAGAVVSGAYFGDKMSPLSETTNLAPAVAGSELFAHIRHMVWTSGPSLAIALLLFAILGAGEQPQGDASRITVITDGITAIYQVSAWNLLPLLLLLAMAIGKVPALPAIFVGALIGGLWAALVQGDSIPLLFPELADQGWRGVVLAIWRASFEGVKVSSEQPGLADLLSGGGMAKMLNTVWLIICAMAFGAVMECTGMLKQLVAQMLKLVQGTGSLVAATLCTCIGVNVVTADQYMSIVMPGRMFREAFRERKLALVNLSRTLEDGGTITSPLIPWNSCGSYMFSVLLVSPADYFMYAFFNLLNPLIAILYGFLGIKILPAPQHQAEESLFDEQQSQPQQRP
ncbi:MAG: Na+/H+ antiporter NhaC [Corallincola sp.]|nr:Na+/H+ antiporter NhaC [Corallincola sp.]